MRSTGRSGRRFGECRTAIGMRTNGHFQTSWYQAFAHPWSDRLAHIRLIDVGPTIGFGPVARAVVDQRRARRDAVMRDAIKRIQATNVSLHRNNFTLLLPTTWYLTTSATDNAQRLLVSFWLSTERLNEAIILEAHGTPFLFFHCAPVSYICFSVSERRSLVAWTSLKVNQIKLTYSACRAAQKRRRTKGVGYTSNRCERSIKKVCAREPQASQ